MSRREGWGNNTALMLAFASLPMPALAQSRGPAASAEDDAACRRQREAALISGEIVVCAERREDDAYRLRNRDEARSAYAAATRDRGTLRPPDFAPPPCKPSLLSFCPKFGAPPPVLFIDVTALPEAPPGSDAARQGSGESDLRA